MGNINIKVTADGELIDLIKNLNRQEMSNNLVIENKLAHQENESKKEIKDTYYDNDSKRANDEKQDGDGRWVDEEIVNDKRPFDKFDPKDPWTYYALTPGGVFKELTDSFFGLFNRSPGVPSTMIMVIVIENNIKYNEVYVSLKKNRNDYGSEHKTRIKAGQYQTWQRDNDTIGQTVNVMLWFDYFHKHFEVIFKTYCPLTIVTIDNIKDFANPIYNVKIYDATTKKMTHEKILDSIANKETNIYPTK